MPAYPLMQVDASADRPLSCNPCTELFNADMMDYVTMLAAAREMNLSETSFPHRSHIVDFGTQCFPPATKISWRNRDIN